MRWARAIAWLLVWSATCLAGSAAHAVLVPIDLFAPGDELATYDTVTDLAWLDLDRTTGMSFDDFGADGGGWAAAGWRPAKTQELCSLINSHAATLDPCPQLLIPDVEPTPQIDALIALLEPTMFGADYSSGEEPGLAAVGLFLDEDGAVGQAGIVDADLARLLFGLPNRAMVFAGEVGGSTDWAASDAGLFLVRPVPEPSKPLLLAVGIASLALARKRRA
jgi:hypothetical protein